jgi:nucleotide-binding universal stress UspA family protein
VEIDQAEEWAKESLDSVLADSREQLIGLSAESILVEGPAAKVLIDESKDADLLVVGSRGRGGFSGLLLGSVSQYVAHHCSCPVVIVRNIPDHQHV